MFVGHLSLALAAKPRARDVNLGWLMAAVCALDLVWPLFLLAGLARWRTPMPIGLLLFALVVSHWVLDVASHAPDMPLWPGRSPKFGLGLWYSVPLTLVVEGTMWLAGIAIFLRTAPPRTTGARIAFWSFVIVCTVMWASGPWGPPPPSARALGYFSLIAWLIIPWAAAADPH